MPPLCGKGEGYPMEPSLRGLFLPYWKRCRLLLPHPKEEGTLCITGA